MGRNTSTQDLRVLIVEDEALIALEEAAILDELGCQVIGIAPTVGAALQLAADARPDLALMDVSLRHRRDGIEAARALRERFGVPVVFVTAHVDAATMQRAEAVDPAAYLAKPFSETQLRAAVQSAAATLKRP